MSSTLAQRYNLHIGDAHSIVWPGGHLKTRPLNLYVEVYLNRMAVQRTAIATRTSTPFWNQSFVISAISSLVLTLSVKHNTSRPFTTDPCIGCLSIELKDLLAKCMNDQDAVLELNAEDGAPSGHAKGFISVKLGAATLAPPKSQFGVHIVILGDNPVVNIIAVHSLDGHAEDLWTAANNINWLRDLLPSEVPSAR